MTEAMSLTGKDALRSPSSFGAFSRLYHTAFPEQERIRLDEMVGLAPAMGLTLTAWYDGGTFVGLTVVCERADANWFWYFAVEENLRGRGYGRHILGEITRRYATRPLILDIESPRQPSANQAQRSRRYAFYLRNGFTGTGVENAYGGVEYAILQFGEPTLTDSQFRALLAELFELWGELPPSE